MAPRLKNALLVLLLVSLGSGVLGCEPEHRWGHERRGWYGAYGPGWYGAPYADGGYHGWHHHHHEHDHDDDD